MILGHKNIGGADPARVAESIETGTLPPFEPAQTLGGLGDGRGCPVCGHVAGDRDVAFTLEWPGRPILHAGCYLAWRHVLRTRARQDAWYRLLGAVRLARSGP
jgi:hypothetical protein